MRRTRNQKTELQRQNRAARLVLSRGNGAKVRVGLCARREVVGQRGVGVARIEMVECVEHFNPELQNPGSKKLFRSIGNHSRGSAVDPAEEGVAPSASHRAPTIWRRNGMPPVGVPVQ